MGLIMAKFIYVFNKAACDLLANSGALLMSADNNSEVFVFLAETVDMKLLDEISFLSSDSLSF